MNGDLASSKIKQVASGRFGVTPGYLVSGDQLEIKIAQGAKPGEGGQLPGAKIDSYIAGLRKSKPGVTLISPPPHHDIYSIEDLAQLIHDLHQVNPRAYVSVKLVSEVGIGTVSSGVAKAGADIIQISGHDGGTGASPVSSIKHAGSPWELGLVETHATLRRNGLRDRVLLRVDGGLKTGWDVVMGAVLGAEEYGFGTIAMIAEGCIMARICHTNKCPVGVTTQNEALRKRFPGTPAHVVTFFQYVAEEVRHILATLGYTSLDQVIGRGELVRARSDVKLKKTQHVDVSYLLESLSCDPKPGDNFCSVDEDRSWLKHGPPVSNGHTLDDQLLADPVLEQVIAGHGVYSTKRLITNTDRSSFARIAGRIASLHGDNGFKGRVRFDLTGAAGQSFCSFLTAGMDINLQGYANDYVAKGMAGGKVTVSPPSDGPIALSSSQSVVGNTVLYGATGGSLFVRGRGGERFAVRNSGAVAVVEGVGDHGCEYMTGGLVVSLGNTGRNFGAGMTGGLAFVFADEAWFEGKSEANSLPFASYVNKETVSLIPLTAEYQAARSHLKELLETHRSETSSSRADNILKNFESACDKFVMVVPASEKTNALVLKVSLVYLASSIC
jgi:glutamate synthase (ferredoxin)